MHVYIVACIRAINSPTSRRYRLSKLKHHPPILDYLSRCLKTNFTIFNRSLNSIRGSGKSRHHLMLQPNIADDVYDTLALSDLIQN